MLAFKLAAAAAVPATPRRRSVAAARCSVGFSPKLPPVQFQPLRSDSTRPSEEDDGGGVGTRQEGEVEEEEEEEEGGRRKGIAGIHVPRQRYIAVPKAALLDAALRLFSSGDGDEEAAAATEFKRFAKCLDSVLHAEHKELLEEMRTYYMLTHQEENGSSSVSKDRAMVNGKYPGLIDSNGTGNDIGGSPRNGEEDGIAFLHRSLDLRSLLGLSPSPYRETRIAFATQFQRSFMKLLRDAQFEELSAQDLIWTYALNSDYLLTLPIYVDWKKASDSNAIIFRRGYATERQKGLLLVEKLDYLQSKLLQNIFFGLAKPLKKLGEWLNEALKRSTGEQDLQIWIDKLKLWLKEQSFIENSLSFLEKSSWDKLESDELPDADLPIWIAAQRAVSRYEGILSPVGPRRRLVRKLLTWTGLIPSLPEATISSHVDTKHFESYLRPNFLPRKTLATIWEPASRESCGNNVWEMVKASVGIFFGKSTLQEPAFQELILLYTDETTQSKDSDKPEMLPLQLKIYERIPIPDLPVVFPHKKLSFRILDTVRLDIATVVGLLAYFVNYKFESIASSPSAFFLDIVAASALLILVFRVGLGYKQTRERYQLLVNKTLYEKTLASGFGSVYFLLDASEQQQYKEALLAYAILLSREKYQASSRTSIKDACERFMYDQFKEKIEMPIDKAMETLLRLGLVIELPTEEYTNVIGLQCSEAYEILRKRWDSLLEQKT